MRDINCEERNQQAKNEVKNERGDTAMNLEVILQPQHGRKVQVIGRLKINKLNY